MSRPLKTFSSNLTFANNSNTSSEIDTKNRTLAAISIPAILTNSSFSLETSEDNVTWLPVYKADGSQVTITVSTSQARFIQMDLEGTNACRWIRLKGSSNEGSARTLRYHLRIVR
jgi:hypothetical protein